MFSISVLAVSLAIVLAAMAIMSVAVVQEPNLVTAGAAAIPGVTLPAGYSRDRAKTSEWNSVELHDLFSVENLLDTLEASNASRTEVEMNGEDSFIVRWK